MILVQQGDTSCNRIEWRASYLAIAAASGTFNPLVAGSNPARPTKIQRKRQLSRVGVFVLRFRIACCPSATNSIPLPPILGSVNAETEHRIRRSPFAGRAIMRTLSTLFAATFAAAFVLGSFAITAATPPLRAGRRGR